MNYLEVEYDILKRKMISTLVNRTLKRSSRRKNSKFETETFVSDLICSMKIIQSFAFVLTILFLVYFYVLELKININQKKIVSELLSL